ncbi:MAG: hypothetical protein DRG78_20460 [Epsilonproteobacteria bacterium]|nr:MAG: hypothetical protein DRG78_20460 [Campylobacterota bacterium]
MIKNILIIALMASWLNAGLVNAAAVIVNNTVITMYDVDTLMEKRNLSHNQAVSALIDNVLYDEEIKNFNIEITDNEINAYIERIAQSNRMDLITFKIAIVQQGQDYNLFVEDTKKRLLNQKLIKKIARGKLKVASEEDMKLFYDNNPDQFRKNKNSIELVPFEEVKNKIFNLVMSQREQQYLKKYFETLKITAQIEIIR